MKNIKICIVGINCSGKSTLLEKLKDLLPHFKIIEGSQALCEIGRIDKQMLKNLDEANKDRLRKEFLANLESTNENVIVSGHYSFLNENATFEIAMKEDVRFYDLILFLDSDNEVIHQRMQNRDNKNISLESIQKWNDFELQGLQIECKKHNVFFSAIDSNASDVGSFIEFFRTNKTKLDPKEIFEDFMKTHTSSLMQTIILTDCDGTLDNKDAVKEFYKIKAVCDFKVPNAFHNHRFYGFYQFFRLTKKRLEIPEKTFLQAVKLAADSMRPHINLIEMLHSSNTSVIAISAGIRQIWSDVFARLEVPFHIIANDRESIITQDCKAYFAKELTNLGYKVIALGDGLVDIGMLEYATQPILIESNKKDLIISQLSRHTREKLIVCNPNISIDSIKAVL